MRIDGACHCGKIAYEAEIAESGNRRAQLTPRLQLWCRSALPWVHDLGSVRQLPRGN